MSRRRGEFEHRTSIFEGAFRAWSHLGGLEPTELESKSAVDLDPLSNPIVNDPRLSSSKKGDKQEQSDDGKRRIYPYEPLPRSGLAHPFVQAILSPWLGPDADNDAIQLGLTTLRTWWQHRRKGESGSAIAALGTEKMKGVVEGYTRHFFSLAHCLIMNDKEQPPRSLHGKMKELEKARNKRKGKKGEDDEDDKVLNASSGVAVGIAADLTNQSLSPLERLHVAQQRRLQVEGVGAGQVNPVPNPEPTLPIIKMKNKCVPGKVDLPGIVDAVNHRATQLAHGGVASTVPSSVPSSIIGSSATNYGDPDQVPIVFVGQNGDVMLAMSVDGITCAHCVKIVETVLKGCNGNKSPIEGLLDAAADRTLCSVLIKIDTIANSKRVAFEAARNLAMVGYTARAKEMSLNIEGPDGKKKITTIESVFKAYQSVALSDPRMIFNWNTPCSCPDNGVLREDCSRHGQMSVSIFNAFEARGNLACQFLAGAKLEPPPPQQQQDMMNDIQPQPIGIGHMGGPMMGGNGMEDFFVSGNNGMHPRLSFALPNGGPSEHAGFPSQRAQRNPSIISFGGRNPSFASEVSYGRAMSGLSALSIDWENIGDFDINVDHSAHINNSANAAGMNMGGNMGNHDAMLDPKPIGGGGGARRSSLRVPFTVGGPGSGGDSDQHVSFKV